MAYKIYDYVCARGTNQIADWTRDLQKPMRAKLNARIDYLALHGEALVPHILTDTPVAGIRKLRVRGNVQLRPILCRGPHQMTTEYTFLIGAIEKGDVLEPRDAPDLGDARRSVVAQDVTRRRDHERIA